MTTTVLFFGTLLDALIGANLFVPGEPFLLAAGYQLHDGIWSGLLAVTLGGLLGDQASYFIGRTMGSNAQRRLIAWQPKTRRAVARFRLLMRTKGNYVLVFARLLGPVAWVVPFLAGSQRIAWQRFSLYATLGLILGVGQWVLWGYLLAAGLDALPWWQSFKTFVAEHQYSLWIVFFIVIMIILGRFWRLPRHNVIMLVGLIYGISWANYSHFFQRSDDFISKAPPRYFQLENVAFKAYPGQSSIYNAQGINVIFYGENPDELMQQLGWIKNKTFSRHDLELSDYWRLLKNKTPPVSDLFWQGQPQHLAYQQAGTLRQRVHIRWWHAGKDKASQQKVWLGAISYDDGLTVTLHSGIPTLLHRVDTDIDTQRENLAAEILLNSNDWSAYTQALGNRVIVDKAHDYHSDGGVLVIEKRRLSHQMLVLNP